MRGRGVESVANAGVGRMAKTECNATKRQQFAAISVEFVHDNQVYRSMLSFICTSGAQEQDLNRP